MSMPWLSVSMRSEYRLLTIKRKVQLINLLYQGKEVLHRKCSNVQACVLCWKFASVCITDRERL